MLHHGCDGDQSRPFPWNGPTSTGEDIYSGVPVPGFGVRTLLQPFDISAPHHRPSPAAGTMASHLGFLFTETQWRELQRQAMIYKYMMASIPVPPGLLSAPPTAPPLSGGFKLRFSGGTDPEPGRCRRTDGKKWRCSRDVALDHKYCERHLHRGRPRSRKPVEHQATAKKSKTSHHHSLTLPIPAPPLTSDATISSNDHRNIMVFDKSSEKATTLEPLPRGLEWMMGPSEHQQWHPHNHNLNLNNPCYTNLNCCEDNNATLCGNKNNNNTIPLPSLSLSMGGIGNNMVEDEKGWIQMGLGVRGWSKNTRDHDWTSQGGPLAKVMRPSSIAEEAGTALSSPSGVLQKMMASFSDSSGNSSPTPSSSAVPLPMLWLKNQ